MLWDIEKDHLPWYRATFYFHDLGDLFSNSDSYKQEKQNYIPKVFLSSDNLKKSTKSCSLSTLLIRVYENTCIRLFYIKSVYWVVKWVF